MDSLVVGFCLLAILAVLLLSGAWVFISLFATGALGLSLLLGYPLDRIGSLAARVILSSAQKWELSAIPLFIFMGELICRTDIAERVFKGLLPIVARIPGTLLHTNVLGSVVFGAVSGSSSATTAMVGKITLPSLEARGFDRRHAIGALAASGGLGMLIPPSIMLIVYGVLVEQSILQLFAAGVIPSLFIAALFASYIAIRFRKTDTAREESSYSFRDVIHLAPVGILFLIVFGAIYSGMATPSESAAIGVLATIIVMGLLRQLRMKIIFDSMISASVISAMICIILVFATFLSSAVGFLHLPQNIATSLEPLVGNPFLLILVLAIFYQILGFFLDGISIAVMTLPIVYPLAIAAGFDPIWFGIFLVIMVEAGLITPPLGLNLFIVRGLTGESIATIAIASLPYYLLMLLATAVFVLIPDIVLWLPEQMRK